MSERAGMGEAQADGMESSPGLEGSPGLAHGLGDWPVSLGHLLLLSWVGHLP